MWSVFLAEELVGCSGCSSGARLSLCFCGLLANFYASKANEENAEGVVVSLDFVR